MYKLFLIVFLVLLSLQLFGQDDGLSRDIDDLQESDQFVLPAMDHQRLIDHYDQDSKAGPLRFAEPRDVHINPNKDGIWEYTRNNKLIWRYYIKSTGAYSINLGFSEYQLPASASLYIYSPDKQEVVGPFGQKDNDKHLQLWTPVIKGDELIIELQLDASDEEYKLLLSRINHDFRDISKNLQSGSCNLDVICSAEDGWAIVDDYREIISSVGAISINGIDQCSGVLINNAKNDCKPYFLTANHCGISSSSAPSVVVYWNYENSVCRQPFSAASGQNGDGSRLQFSSGSILRANYPITDFALIELDDPVVPEYELYYAGWNREMILADTSVSIHHPNVEEKRISFEFNRLDWDPNGTDTTHLLVNDWDVGTTEGGSSGAPLFNTNSQVIGHLNGGLAACGNDDYDSYGWMGRSWEGGGERGNSLKFWLDPDNNDIRSLNGKSCNYSIIVENNYFEICGLEQDSLDIAIASSGQFEGTLEYKLIDFPIKLTGVFDFTSGQHDESNVLHVSGLSRVLDNELEFKIEITDGINAAQAEIQIIVENNEAIIPETISPPSNAVDQSINLFLEVTNIPGSEFRYQLSTDDQFTSIVIDELSSSEKLFVKNLKPNENYYWRVQSINFCGHSEWSDISFFSTAFVFCTTLYSFDGPMEISSTSPETINSVINIPYGVIVEDINVLNVQGSHEYISDLEVKLSLSNLSSTLFSDICDDEENFDLGFDDEADKSSIDCPPVDRDLYIPHTPLDVFVGTLAGGEWNLSIEDLAFLDGGEFREWTMELCFTNSPIATLVPEDHRLFICDDEPLSFSCYIDTRGIQNYQIRMFDENSEEIEIDYSQVDDRYLIVELNDTDQFTNSKSYARLEFYDMDQNSIISQSILDITKSITIAAPEILYPENEAILNSNSFNTIEWWSEVSAAFHVQIATDVDFENIIFTQSGNEANTLNLKDELPPGDYFLRVILDEDKCPVISSVVAFSLTVETSTTSEIETDLNLFPNPVYESLFVKNTKDNLSNYSIYNSRGEEFTIHVIRIQQDLIKFDLSGLTQGVYFISYRTKGSQSVQRFVKF